MGTHGKVDFCSHKKVLFNSQSYSKWNEITQEQLSETEDIKIQISQSLNRDALRES